MFDLAKASVCPSGLATILPHDGLLFFFSSADHCCNSCLVIYALTICVHVIYHIFVGLDYPDMQPNIKHKSKHMVYKGPRMEILQTNQHKAKKAHFEARLIARRPRSLVRQSSAYKKLTNAIVNSLDVNVSETKEPEQSPQTYQL